MYGRTPGERSSEGQITSFTTKYRRDIYLPVPTPSVRDSGIRETFVCGYVDFGLWNPEYSSGSLESTGAFHLSELAGWNMAGSVSLKMKSAFPKTFC